MIPIRDLHWSLVHGMSAWTQARVLAILDAEADVAGFTESRRIALDEAPSGWSGWRGEDDETRNIECLVAFRDARFEPLYWGTGGRMRGDQALTDLAFRTGSGHVKHGVWITWEIRRDVLSGRRLLRAAFHAPASVQAGGSWSDKAKRVAASQATFLGLRRFVLRMAPHCDDMIISFDANLDVRRTAWRAYLDGILAGTGCRVLVPESGTHRGSGRAIDVRVTNMFSSTPESVVRPDALGDLDHRRTADDLAEGVPLGSGLPRVRRQPARRPSRAERRRARRRRRRRRARS